MLKFPGRLVLKHATIVLVDGASPVVCVEDSMSECALKAALVVLGGIG
jgi:hypothetical protein